MNTQRCRRTRRRAIPRSRSSFGTVSAIAETVFVGAYLAGQAEGRVESGVVGRLRRPIRADFIRPAKMFELMGDDAAKSASEAQAVMTLETKFAEASKPPVELRDPEKNYHRTPMAQLRDVAPTFDWSAYFQRVGLVLKADVNVGQPEFFKAFDAQLTATPIADWQIYLRWNLINATASSLGSKLVDEDFHFKGTILSGAKENLPRWKRCVAATDRALGEALGEVYVQKAFPPAAKQRALDMVRNLEATLKEDIGTLSWMGDTTRNRGLFRFDLSSIPPQSIVSNASLVLIVTGVPGGEGARARMDVVRRDARLPVRTGSRRLEHLAAPAGRA